MPNPRLRLPLLLLALLAGCPDQGDVDGDGALAELDCDDDDPSVYPGAEEVVGDGVDQDCNGADTVLCFYDADEDGFGFGEDPNQADADGVCSDDPLQSPFGGDCDDTRPVVFPGATDLPDDGIDQDCSGADTASCRADDDGDGVGSEVAVVEAEWPCSASGLPSEGGDCDDQDPDSFPGAPEVADDGVDQDCDGFDTISCFVDIDQDGFGAPVIELAEDGSCDLADSESALDTDCDDSRADISPVGIEIPDDGADQDCDGFDARTCFSDGDGDGYGAGDPVVNPLGACSETSGFSWVHSDCDDGDAAISPLAGEVVDDGIDQDCSGADTVTCLYDGDADGFGAPGTESLDADGSCLPADNQASLDGDCDDGADSIYPGAPEVADDGFDQDCSGADTVTCFVDGDGDGFGAGTALDADGDCTDDPGQSALDGDCDDVEPTAFPGGTELAADGIDQDCDGNDGAACFYDGDGDGFGDLLGPQVGYDGTCGAANLSASSDDCDDTQASRYPSAPEQCNNLDDDCDGVLDHGALAAFLPPGGSARIELPAFTTGTPAITVEAWIRARGADWLSAPAVFKHRPSVGEDLWLGAEASVPDNLVRSSVFGFASDTVTGGDAPAFVWRHVAMSYDGAQQNLYVDGALVGSSSGAGPLTLDPAGIWVLGGSLDAAGAPLASWYGAIDEVRIWSVALSETAIADGRCAPADPTDPDLLAYFPLEGDLLDATGGGNDGVAVPPNGVTFQGR